MYSMQTVWTAHHLYQIPQNFLQPNVEEIGDPLYYARYEKIAVFRPCIIVINGKIEAFKKESFIEKMVIYWKRVDGKLYKLVAIQHNIYTCVCLLSWYLQLGRINVVTIHSCN